MVVFVSVSDNVFTNCNDESYTHKLLLISASPSRLQSVGRGEVVPVTTENASWFTSLRCCEMSHYKRNKSIM